MGAKKYWYGCFTNVYQFVITGPCATEDEAKKALKRRLQYIKKNYPKIYEDLKSCKKYVDKLACYRFVPEMKLGWQVVEPM